MNNIPAIARQCSIGGAAIRFFGVVSSSLVLIASKYTPFCFYHDHFLRFIRILCWHQKMYWVMPFFASYGKNIFSGIGHCYVPINA